MPLQNIDQLGTVVGLVSGGKDSLFALHCCTHFGYTLEAVCHIRPAIISDEVDSYMYQTVGSQFLEPIAKCLGLPLVVHELKGTPNNTNSLRYDPTEGDEVEDLYTLLHTVKTQFPNVKYVSSGAILSNYQRERVENVCQRLGLISLAFLWNFQQSVLLNLMIHTAEFEPIIIKIASMGLDGSDLGQTLQSLSSKFFTLEKQFGFHCCGEGGEFETIILNSPLFLTEKIFTPKWETVIHSDDAFAPVMYLRPIEPIRSIKKESLDHTNIPTISQSKHSFPPFNFVTNHEYYYMDILGESNIPKFIRSIDESKKHVLFVQQSIEKQCSIPVGNIMITTPLLDGIRKCSSLENLSSISRYQAEPEMIRFYFLTKKIDHFQQDLIHNNFNTGFELFVDSDTDLSAYTTISRSLSVSLWRPSPVFSQDLCTLDGYLLPQQLFVSQWLLGQLPHNGKTIHDADIQDKRCYHGSIQPDSVPIIIVAHLALAIRNLRNLLFDLKTSLSHVRLLDIILDTDKCKNCTNRQIEDIVTEIWFRNQGDIINSKDGFELFQNKERQLWETIVTNDRTITTPSIECNLYHQSKIIQSQPICLRLSTTDKPKGSLIALRSVVDLSY